MNRQQNGRHSDDERDAEEYDIADDRERLSGEHPDEMPNEGGQPLPEVEKTETVETEHSPDHSDAPADVASDPALDDRLGSDWIDEGGATSVGPATSTPGGVETEASKREVRIDRERDEREAAEQSGEHIPSRERPATETG